MGQSQKNKVEWVHCNLCLRRTRHEVVATRTDSEPLEVDNGSSIDWQTTYTMLECCGCGSVTLRRRDVSCDSGTDDTRFYPPPVSRQIPRWYYDLPNDFQTLMKEIYAALHADSRRLALMGARALIELFMNSTIGEKGTFQQKLERLVGDGYLSSKSKGILEAALDAGHAATHRAYNPTADDVNLVFDIVENLVQTLVLEKNAEKLKKHTPRRQVRKRAGEDSE